jgi:hypothetical protein
MDRRSEDAKAETIELNLYPAISVPNSLVADGRGWPFLSMTCSWDYGTVVSTTPKGERLKGGIELSPFEGAGDRGMIPYYRALPYHLLWPGFIVNTIFYAAILWVVWISSSKIRRIVIARSRIKRHRCAACGYQIAEGVGPVCSECGHPLTKASS